ncbi:MAG: hypothetical protein JST54_16985, partial [Deltaproteobacteria bacterium]|nr:hypothetical protein [Deltaproteobacteria bacterium]
MNKAVHKLNADLSRYSKAQKAEKSAEGALTKAKTSEQNALKSIATQRQAIADQFQSNPTMDAATMQKLLAREFALGEKQVQVQDAFAKTSASDKATIAKDKKAIASDKKTALKDLKPAEYHLSLKETNKDRKELGLKALKAPLRQTNTGGQKVVDLAKKYLGKFESQLQREGVTQPCPTNESCANFVTSMLQKAGAINFHTLAVSTLNSDLRARGWHAVSLKDAKPGDVWICNGAHGESHT